MIVLILAVLCTVSTAHAATAAPYTPAASGKQCNFVESLATCASTDPTVAYTTHAYGDTSSCSFLFDILWGDGASVTRTVVDPADGYHLLAQHTYASPGTYTIAVSAQVTAGACTATSSVHTFTLVKPVPVTNNVNNTWSGYGGSASITRVGADWHVPTLNCFGQGFGQIGTPHPAAAQWIGLGGTGGNQDLEQVGIVSQCVAGIQVNNLVWEILPQYTKPVVLYRYVVFAGDEISAVVKKDDGKRYSFSVRDSNRLTGWKWQADETQQDSAAIPDSVEWVVEAQPGQTAHFSPITYTGCYYYDASGHYHVLNVSKFKKFEATGPHGPYTSVSGNGDSLTVKFVRSS